MKKEKSALFISGFILKIIGYITMTFDHLGVFLEMFAPNTYELAEIFRKIGRLAFPLFVFMIVEGIIHTKNFKKYILRLGILASILILSEVVIYYFFYNGLDFPSPITDLFFIALAIYFINRKDKFSFFAILPIAYVLLCFGVEHYEATTFKTVTFLPFFLRTDYTMFGLLLALGFYAAIPLSKIILKSNQNTASLEGTKYEQLARNILSVLVVMTVSFLFDLLDKNDYDFIGIYNCIYAMWVSVPLLFYSGKRGYNAKWFQIGGYLYFPLHLIILFIIFYMSGLIGGIL